MFLSRRDGRGHIPDEKNIFFSLAIISLYFSGRKLASIIFKDGFCGFARRSVKQNNGSQIFTKWFCNAGDLLRQNPKAYTGMAG